MVHEEIIPAARVVGRFFFIPEHNFFPRLQADGTKKPYSFNYLTKELCVPCFALFTAVLGGYHPYTTHTWAQNIFQKGIRNGCSGLHGWSTRYSTKVHRHERAGVFRINFSNPPFITSTGPPPLHTPCLRNASSSRFCALPPHMQK